MDNLAERLFDWLALLDGPDWKGQEARDRSVAEMRAVGCERLFPLLAAMLDNPDMEVRCQACLAILLVDVQRGLDLVLPLLDDTEAVVRWCICELLRGFGDDRAIDPLIVRMKEDPDSQVRGTAAFALGGIRSPKAIPALLETLDNDHEEDILGYTPSFIAAQALDDILGTEETRIRVSNSLYKMRPGKPDLEKLRRMALHLFHTWSESGN